MIVNPVQWTCPKCRGISTSATPRVGQHIECGNPACRAIFKAVAQKEGKLQLQEVERVATPVVPPVDLTKRQPDEPSGESFLERLRRIAKGEEVEA